MRHLTAGLPLLMLAAAPAAALPVFGSEREVAGIRVYADDRSPTTFYYGPGKLAIVRDTEGRPEIRFLQTRYTGTAVGGDRGQFRTWSTLTFKVRMEGVEGPALKAAQDRLRAEGKRILRFRALPVRRIETTLNYVPLKEGAEPEKPAPAGKGSLEAGEGNAPEGEFWMERIFTLAPDDLTSQALWEAMKGGKVILSLSYAFHAAGVLAKDQKPVVTGNVPIPVAVPGGAPGEGMQVVGADTVAITVDAARIPDCLKRVDLNEQVPANYAALSVYCYDFNNELRPDLEEKLIEIQATSVTGKPVVKEVSFSRSSPDVYSATARFQFAVSLKHPYRYRIREVTREGEVRASPWRDGKPWSQMLDLTTPPEERPKPAPPAEDGEDR
jgi:hypothetical protein